MKTIYLVRHGEPVSGRNRCIGYTDVPLSDSGLYQAGRLREWFSDKKLAAICSSPLDRCVQTARIIADRRMPIDIWPALREMDGGLWENMSFDDIRKQYPKEYEERGRHLGTVAPPEGESFMKAGLRFGACVENLARQIDGDFVVVGHSGASRGFLCPLMGINPDDVFSIRQPWGALSVLQWNGEKFTVLSVGMKPDRQPSDFVQRQLLERHETSERIVEHCSAVACLACIWAEQLETMGIPVDTELLRAACKLHDIVRSVNGTDHAKQGAKLLDSEGFPAVAELIKQHHNLEPDASLEAKLLYLSDKMILETEKVTLAQRYENSKKKCLTAEALEAWQHRYDDALSVEEELKDMLGVDEL